MSYTGIINFIFSIISAIILLLFAHYVVLAIAGILTYKKYPKTEHKNRFGLIIPAKNEETVIESLIKSVRETNYPQELLDIFVVAHNCSDKTAEIARQTDAHVYEYNNPNENTMGYAIRHLFSQIEKDYGTSNYDGFFIFNADNTFDKEYFNKMNDAFNYYDKKYVISSFRQASNFNENLMTIMYGVYFGISCYLGARGRTLFNTSNRIFGCGYLFNSDLVKNGWDYYSLTEDLEFTTREFMKGTEIRYCDEAVFFDEQPTTFRIMWRQRLRWARGVLIVSREHFVECVKSFFDRGRKNRFAIFDMSTFISRIITVIIFSYVLRVILLLFTPMFGESIKDAFLYWDSSKSWIFNLFRSNQTGALFSIISGTISGGFTALLTYIGTMFVGRKRFKSLSIGKVIGAFVLFPLFILSQFVLDMQALFSNNLIWKQIPHTGNKDQN